MREKQQEMTSERKRERDPDCVVLRGVRLKSWEGSKQSNDKIRLLFNRITVVSVLRIECREGGKNGSRPPS